MGKKIKKLNSMRLLEANSIPYDAIPYDSSVKDAEQVAKLVGMEAFMVYKTLIVQSIATPKNIMVAMIASNQQLDLKLMAAAADEKKVKMAKHDDAEQLTGLKVGGISPLMLTQKNWPIFLDQPAQDLEYIVISAGQRGIQLKIPALSLIQLLEIKIAPITQD